MKLVSYNVNGIHAFVDKGGLHDTLERLDPDLICFQETKGDKDKFAYETSDHVDNYVRYHTESSYKKGYAGVGILLKRSWADKVIKASHADLENTYGSGRIMNLEFEKFNFIGVYTLNSGDKDDLRLLWDERFREYIQNQPKPVIIMGDLNVVPEQLDYWSDLEVARNTWPGLKDYERSNHTKLMCDCGLVDSYRHLNPSEEKYSWFSYRGNAYNKNQGWRIDLALVHKDLLPYVESSHVHDDIRWSDHCPIELNINL